MLWAADGRGQYFFMVGGVVISVPSASGEDFLSFLERHERC